VLVLWCPFCNRDLEDIRFCKKEVSTGQMPLHCSDQRRQNINLLERNMGIYIDNWELIFTLQASESILLQYHQLMSCNIYSSQNFKQHYLNKVPTWNFVTSIQHSHVLIEKTRRNIYGVIHKDTIGILREVTLKHSCMVYFSKCGEWSLNSGSSIMVCFSS